MNAEIVVVVSKEIPKPLGNTVIYSHYFDLNLYHNKVTSHSVMGIFSMMNQTPIDWCAKKHPTVERTIYGYEFDSSGTCVD